MASSDYYAEPKVAVDNQYGHSTIKQNGATRS